METTHKKNIRIIVAMLAIAYGAIVLFAFGACSVLKKNKQTKTEVTKQETTVNTIEATAAQTLDFSKISQEDYTIQLTPINPLQEMRVTTPAGTTIFHNTKPTLKKETKTTENNITNNIQQAKTTQAKENNETRTEEATRNKQKASIPWAGLFSFAIIMLILTIIILYIRSKIKQL